MVFGLLFAGGGISQISDMHFQITLTSDHVAEHGLVLFSELREYLTKKRRKKERKKEERRRRSLVKYKSADNYVGRPKNVAVTVAVM